MAKGQAEDMTGAHNPQVILAIRTIGQGLLDLCDALIAPESSQPEPRPVGSRSPKASPPAEEPSDDSRNDDQAEVKLADLQKMAKDLIKAGGRPKLLKILEEHELENVSSAPVELWPTLKRELEAVSE